jgi:hypothetical protein
MPIEVRVRELEPKHGALAQRFARERAAIALGKFASDSKAMSMRGIALGWSAKQPRRHFRRQTRPIVGDFHFGAFLGARDRNFDPAQSVTCARHLHRVVQEVEQNPKYIVLVRQHEMSRAAFHFYREALRTERRDEIHHMA